MIRMKFAAIILAMAVFLAPAPASAQCEFPGVTQIAAVGFAASTVALLNANYLATPPTGGGILPTAWTLTTQVTQALLNAALKAFETRLYNRLRDFWDDYLEALQNMTGQLNSSLADGTRNMNSLFDTSNMTLNQRSLQQIEVQAKKQFQPTNEGCRFDTAAKYMATTTRTAKAISTGLGKENTGVALNGTGSDAQKGPGQLAAVRWNRYRTLFCDDRMNGGKAGCAAGNPLVNAHVTPSKTLFGRETIPMNTDPNYKLAVNELVYNLIGYEAPAPIPQDALAAPSLKDRRQEQRAYATQMDAVGALIYDVVGERTPGEAAPEVQALRQSQGITDANARPSDREIRQSTLEQLWNPSYYVDLQDSSSTTNRKEVFLQAYNLMLIYKLVDKTEKMANVFVAETSNWLDENQGDLTTDQQSNVPIR
ncbi:MAG: hypothetical protein PSY14_13165 [bacterium]|nr:hypothetical protein [bacterium]